jgi:hypothetical protein
MKHYNADEAILDVIEIITLKYKNNIIDNDNVLNITITQLLKDIKKKRGSSAWVKDNLKMIASEPTSYLKENYPEYLIINSFVVRAGKLSIVFNKNFLPLYMLLNNTRTIKIMKMLLTIKRVYIKAIIRTFLNNKEEFFITKLPFQEKFLTKRDVELVMYFESVINRGGISLKADNNSLTLGVNK